MARIRKQTLVKIFAVIRQAELSLDAAIAVGWEGLLNYYQGSRIRKLRSVSRLLDELVKDSPGHAVKWSLRESRWGRRSIGLMNRPLKSVPLKGHQVAFLSASAAATVRLLEAKNDPGGEAIVEIRTMLTECEFMIEDLLGGSADIRRAKLIEHLSMPTFIEHVELSEFCDRAL